MSNQKFSRDVGLIMIIQVFTNLSYFPLLAIITKNLGTYDYGIWVQINVTVSLISSLALMGLSMSFVRFLSSETETKIIREAVYSILFFAVIAGSLASFLLYISAEPLATLGFKEPLAIYFIQAGSLLILVNVIESILLIYFRVFRQIQKFFYLILFEASGKLFFVLVLFKMGYGLLGVITATLLVQSITILIAFLIIISQIGFVLPRFTYIKKYLQFSLLRTPNSLVRWITESSDRYMVTYFLGLRSVGVYSAACSIGSLIQLFVSSLQLILLPELSKLFDENKMDEVKIYMSHSLRYFLLISIPAVFGLSALAKPLLGILTTEDFLSGWLVIPIIAFSGLLAGIFQIFVSTMFFDNKIKNVTYINVVAAISNVLTNLLLIPSIGIVGASLSTLFSYFLMAVLCMMLYLKYFKLDFYVYDIIKSILSSIAMYLFISYFAISSIFEFFGIAVIGIFIYLVIMFLVGGFRYHELSLIKKYLLGFKI